MAAIFNSPERLREDVRRWALITLRDMGYPDEIAQTAFAAAWSKRERGKTIIEFKPLLVEQARQHDTRGG